MNTTFVLILKSFSVPTGTPQNCINMTYNARDVVLQWEEPIRTLQNGKITGYNLTCHSVNPWEDLSADLSATQSSATTSFTIDPVSPFTEYTCSLSAINSAGQSPPTQCSFSTQQDGQRRHAHFCTFSIKVNCSKSYLLYIHYPLCTLYSFVRLTWNEVSVFFYLSPAPDDPPQELRSDRTMNSVTFHWLPPNMPNGIIRRYVFSIFTAGASSTKELTPVSGKNTLAMDGFHPYQFYSVNVTASTSVNGIFADSSPAKLNEFTLPDSELPLCEWN